MQIENVVYTHNKIIFHFFQVNGDDAVNKDISRVCGVQGEHIEVLLVPLNSMQKCLMGNVFTFIH